MRKSDWKIKGRAEREVPKKSLTTSKCVFFFKNAKLLFPVTNALGLNEFLSTSIRHSYMMLLP